MSLCLVLLVLLCGWVRADGYWDIELSPQSVGSVPFGSGHITVWEHETSRGRYYATPLVYLLEATAATVENVLTREYEMTFDVLMWSIEAKEAVYRHLKATVNSNVKQDHVEMLPMEKIRIAWRDRIRPIYRDFKLVDHWKSNTDLPTIVTFQFTCPDAVKCNELCHVMQTSPNMFDALELEYVINGQRTARRVMTVTGNHLMHGQLYTKLANMPSAISNMPSAISGERYVTSDDLKTITSESVSNVIAGIVTDSDYVDTGDEISMKDVLMNELRKQEVSTERFQPHMWDSVFWDPNWARPDKMTHYLNKVLSKDTSDAKQFLLDENQSSLSGEGKADGSFLGIMSVSGSGGSSSSSQSKVQKEDVMNTLREKHSDIEWTGEVFQVKPMKLYRLNLSTLNTSTNVATANIQVRRYESVHSIKLRLTDKTPNQTPSLTLQLVEKRLYEKIAESNAENEKKLIKAEERITAHLNVVSSEFQRRLADSEREWKKRLTSIESKLTAIPGWPGGSYCVLADGSCPKPFVPEPNPSPIPNSHIKQADPIAWPLGYYGLPQTNQGCPDNDNKSFRWMPGKRFQREYSYTNIAPSQEHFPEATILSLGDSRVRITHAFCMKDTDKGSVFAKAWPKGSYCIYKYNSCPSGFGSGYVWWNDVGNELSPSSEGYLPDGVYDYNTEIRYCCRDDEAPIKEILLPTSKPFFLLKKSSKCQRVAGMKNIEYAFDVDVQDNAIATSVVGGNYPAVEWSRSTQAQVKLFYCYYVKE